MKIQQLIDLLEHTKKECRNLGIPGDIEIIFQYDNGEKARQYDVGDKGRIDVNRFMISPWETNAHIDGWNRFVLSIRRIPPAVPTEAMKKAWDEGLRRCGVSEEGIRKSRAEHEQTRQRMCQDPELAYYFEPNNQAATSED